MKIEKKQLQFNKTRSDSGSANRRSFIISNTKHAGITTRQRSQLSNTFSAWLMMCASRASPNQTTAGLSRPPQPLCSHLKKKNNNSGAQKDHTSSQSKQDCERQQGVKTEDTTHLGSCSTDMLASSESGSGALRGHLVRVVVSRRGQQHICHMHQLLMRPSSSVLGSFKPRGRKARSYLMLPCLMMPRMLQVLPEK